MRATLQDLGYGVMCDDLGEFEVKMRGFLAQMGRCRENIKRQNFFGNEAALARILEFCRQVCQDKAASVAVAGTVGW